MNIGIYALYWEIPDLIYIGQSVDVKRRKYVHFSKLKDAKHENYKVQDAYNKHGQPEFIVLQTCTKEELSILGYTWAKEFSETLNIVDPGNKAGNGLHAPASIYSKRTILKVFS